MAEPLANADIFVRDSFSHGLSGRRRFGGSPRRRGESQEARCNILSMSQVVATKSFERKIAQSVE
jgi:hypothetical protein